MAFLPGVIAISSPLRACSADREMTAYDKEAVGVWWLFALDTKVHEGQGVERLHGRWQFRFDP